MKYKKSSSRNPDGTEYCLLRLNDDNSVTAFPINPDSPEYQDYLKWIAEGNEVLPAEYSFTTEEK